jgi:hypothetical protein
MSFKNLDFNEKILLLLYFSENHKTLITRAMKLMFLFEELFEIKGDENLNFISYKLGPFAENFQINIAPLINEQIISYKEICDRNSTYIPIDCKRLYHLNPERETEVGNVLKENYINNLNLKNEIQIIEILSKYYDDLHYMDLVQLCYFIKPEFTNKSLIKEDVINHNKSFNQNLIINLIEILDKENFIRLFSNIDGILEIFSTYENNFERESFKSILIHFINSIKKQTEIDKKSLINTIDNISIKENEEIYKTLKYKLL